MTQLALAFQLDHPQQPQQQSVYAFLPLRSYGLRFVLQADWQVGGEGDGKLASSKAGKPLCALNNCKPATRSLLGEDLCC